MRNLRNIADMVVEETLDDNTRETWLNIVSATFKPGDKWRFNDGETNFYASVSDNDFIAKVIRNEVEFGAATKLKVLLREIQFTDTKGQLHKESEIKKVVEIRKPAEQLALEWGIAPPTLIDPSSDTKPPS